MIGSGLRRGGLFAEHVEVETELGCVDITKGDAGILRGAAVSGIGLRDL